MGERADVVVVGAGIVGSAVALELTRRGRSVTLLERFDRGHHRGSSHGPTRIFRLSYPDPAYVELAMQARADWKRLERDSRTQLIRTVGGLDVGAGASICAHALQEAGAESRWLTPAEVRETFDIHLEEDALLQPEAAAIDASGALAAQLELARAAGAQVRFGSRVIALTPHDRGCDVAVEGSDEIAAQHVVLAAGPWTKPLAATAGIELDLVVTREEVGYFTVVKPLPVVIDWTEPVKYLVPQAFSAPADRAGLHHGGEVVDPENGPFQPIGRGGDELAQWLSAMSGGSVSALSFESCLYTNTYNEDFLIRHSSALTIASACSGHGFKFGPRTGRLVADLIDGKDHGLPGRLATEDRVLKPI